MRIKKYETKDRYGNSKSFEFFEGSDSIDVPGMTNMPDHPGSPRGTDTVPAWLTPGEFVINKEATDKYGPLLKEINDEGREMQQGQPMYAATGTPVRRDNEAMSSIVTSTDWIDDDLLDNLKLIESGGRHFNDDGTLVTSPAGALGAYQWMPASAKNPGYGIQGFDPTTISEEGMRGKTKEYLRQIQLHNPTWNKEKVLRAYNAGPTTMARAEDKFNETGKSITDEAYNYPYKVIQGTQSPNYNVPNVIDSSVGDEPMYPAITQEILGPDIQTLDSQIKDTEAKLALIKKEEVATEDPSFLDRAGDFLSDVLSNYRDKRKAYNRQLSQGFFNMPTLMPEYYAEGDEVRDYYRSGIPMPGSAPTYNYSSAPTWEIMADNIKSKLEKEEAERVRKAYEERFGAVDQLSMDRLTSMRLQNKLDNLKRERDALNLKRFKNAEQGSMSDLAEMKLTEQLDASRKGTREDAFNKNYYTGVPGDVPSADEFMNIPKDAMPLKIEEEVLKAYDPKFYDAFGNSYDDAEQASKSDLINEADSKAAMQRQMQINSLGQRFPITDKPFSEMSASEAASLDDANLSLYQDMDVPEVKEPEVTNNEAEFDTTSGVGNQAVKNLFEMKQGNKEASMIIYQKRLEEDISDMKNKITTAIESGNPADAEYYINRKKKLETKLDKSKKRLKEIEPVYDKILSKKKNQDTEALERALKYAESIKDNELANKIKLQLQELKDDSLKARVDPPVVTQVKKDLAIDNETDTGGSDTGSALTNRLDIAIENGDGSDTSISTDVKKVEDKGKEVGSTEKGKQQQDKAEGFLKKFFGDLLDTDELKRMAILYVGSRAMGASHNGSLAWAGKYYLKRVETKDARHAKNVEKAIAAKLYTPASIEKYKKSRKESDLKPIMSGSTFEILGNRKELFNQKLNKRDQAIEVKMTGANGLEQKFYTFNPYDKNKPGYMQPASMDWGSDDSGVPGTSGYASLLASNVKLAEDVYKDAIDADNKLFAEAGSFNRLGTGAKTFANQTAEWAMNLNYDAARLGDASRLAYAAMIKDMDANPTKRPSDIRPYLNAALIRQSSNIGGNLFEPLDGKTPNTERIINLNKQFMSTGKNPVKDWESLRGRDDLSDKYKNAVDLFNEDLKNNPDYINTTVTNNVKPGESLFMAWLRREMAGLGPK